VAHFFYGAIVDLPALVLFTLLSAIALVCALQTSSRQELARLTPMGLVVVPFTTVLVVAAWSLTAAVPGGPHPIWEWAGLPPSSTLNRSATVIEMIKLLGLAAVFVVGCLLGARASRARTVFGLILAVGGVYALVSLTVFIARAQILSDGRLGGGFDLANVAGTQFGVLVVLAAAWAAQQWSRHPHATLMSRLTDIAPVLALIMLFVACLLLTASRAAISMTGLAVVLFLGWAALDNRRGRWPLMVVGGVLIVVALTLLLQGNTLFADRLGTLADGDDSRLTLAAAHWQAFLDSPLMGYGLGTYSQVNNQIMTAANAEVLSRTTVLHNVYLQWLEEAGVIGATPMFVLIAVILGVTLWRTIRRPGNRTLVAGLLAGSVVVVLHAAVDVSLNTPSFQAFWTLMLGLGFALSQAPTRQR
jgi:O-antigen ligase